MNNRILNEVKRNRELMGLNESEVDEQLGTAIKQGFKKGYEKAKSFFSRKKDTLDGTSGTLDGTREGVEITYDIGPKFTVFKYDTKGAINGHFTLDMELRKLGLDANPNYYEGTVNDIATYKIPNEIISDIFSDDEDEKSENDVFMITYEGKEYKVDIETLTGNTKNGYFDIDGVRFYYGIGTPNTSQSNTIAINNKIKDIEEPTSSETKVTNNDDGSTTTTKTDVTLASTNDYNRLKTVKITPRVFNLGNSKKEITVGV